LEHFEDCNFYKVVDSVVAVLQEANKFFESQKPWELKRNESELEGILCITIETLRVCGIILQPIIPKTSSQLLGNYQSSV
jgi:methionyl-tRNA synthetase